MIKIRTAVKEDLSILYAFEQGIVVAERPFDPTIREGHVNYYDLAKLVDDPSAAVVVAEVNGQIVASGYAVKKEARPYLDHSFYAYLGFMYTLPEYRGQGINAMVLEALVQWARANGLTEVRLTVYDGNEGAIKAYEKVGFKKHIVEMRLS